MASDISLAAKAFPDPDTTLDFEEFIMFDVFEKFTLFPKPPPELRLKIWRHAIPGPAGPRIMRIEAQDGWTTVRNKIMDKGGSGFTVITKERFKLQFVSADNGCSLYRACRESRQVMVKRFPFWLPSATVNKEIRFGQSDLVAIDNIEVLIANLKRAVKNGVRIPKNLSHLHTLVLFGECSWVIDAVKPYFKDLHTIFLCLAHGFAAKIFVYESVSGGTFKFLDLPLVGRNDREKKMIERSTIIKEEFESGIRSCQQSGRS